MHIQAKSQEDSWPDIVPTTTINLTDSEPDGQPDSQSQQPSLKDLLLNLTSSSAEQISCYQAASQSYEQSHLSPVPIACAGPVSSDPSTLSRVAITNLSSQVDEDDLIPFLGSRGKLLSLLPADDASTKTATVAYPSFAEAQEAVVNWHGKACYGLPVSVAVIHVNVTPPPPGFPPSLQPPTSLLPVNYTAPHPHSHSSLFYHTTHTFTLTHIHTHSHTHILPTHSHTHTTHIHTHNYSYTHTYTYTHIYTHTHVTTRP